MFPLWCYNSQLNINIQLKVRELTNLRLFSMLSFYGEEENVNDPRDECEESPQSEEGEGREEPRSGKVNFNF